LILKYLFNFFMKKQSIFIFYLVISLFCAKAIFAQTAGSKPFAAMPFRFIGPDGNRAIAVVGEPGNPMVSYVGAASGGIWKTTDGGLNWKPVTDGQLTSSSVGAVAVAESNPDIIYIGTGETEFRGNIMQGDGVYKSIDGGKNWKNVE
jgi:photosystem II stability/assembly factor-like uncharacterized protein